MPNPPSAPRHLPAASAPLTLDAILASASATPQPHARARPTSASHQPFALSGAASKYSPGRGAASPSNASPPTSIRELCSGSRAAPSLPTALLLSVSISHCACGSTTRAVAPYVLARYAVNEHSFRYSRADLADCADLPRERRETHIHVPFCEACF